MHIYYTEATVVSSLVKPTVQWINDKNGSAVIVEGSSMASADILNVIKHLSQTAG